MSRIVQTAIIYPFNYSITWNTSTLNINVNSQNGIYQAEYSLHSHDPCIGLSKGEDTVIRNDDKLEPIGILCLYRPVIWVGLDMGSPSGLWAVSVICCLTQFASSLSSSARYNTLHHTQLCCCKWINSDRRLPPFFICLQRSHQHHNGPLGGGTWCFYIGVLTHVVHCNYDCTCRTSFDWFIRYNVVLRLM